MASSFAERHVGFALEGNEEDDEEGEYDEDEEDGVDGKKPQRLHRRDTPHHLKNKRINLNKVDEEKAADLIAHVSFKSFFSFFPRLFRMKKKDRREETLTCMSI